jgi:hypothetical protein
MDALQALELTTKGVRSVVRWGFGYGRQLRDAYVDAKTALEDAGYQAAESFTSLGAEAARQRLVEREEAEEVSAGTTDRGELRYEVNCACPLCATRRVRAFCIGAPTPNPPAAEVAAGSPPAPSAAGTIDPSRMTAPTVRDEGSPAGDVGGSPAGERPNVDAISATLAGHVFEHGELLEDRGLCSCGKCPWDWTEWRTHVAPIIASRLECLAADRRVADRLDAAGFAKNTFEQHRNK